jgi:hypothetical protein
VLRLKVVIATDSNDQNEYFMTKFFAEGHEPYKALGEDELLDTLEKKDIQMLIFDYDSDKYSKFEIIKKVKLTNNDLVIIVLTYKSDFDFVKKSHELGIFSIIPKIEDVSRQFAEITIALSNLSGKKEEKRKYMRVKPKSDEKNFVKMKIPGIQTIYTGRVLDISMGGALVDFLENISDSLLYVGKVTALNMQIENMVLRLECNVVLKRGKSVALRFKNLNEANLSNLSRYILTRIE